MGHFDILLKIESHFRCPVFGFCGFHRINGLTGTNCFFLKLFLAFCLMPSPSLSLSEFSVILHILRPIVVKQFSCEICAHARLPFFVTKCKPLFPQENNHILLPNTDIEDIKVHLWLRG